MKTSKITQKQGEKLKDDNYSRILSTFKFVYLTGLHAVQFGNNWMEKIPRTAQIGRGQFCSIVCSPIAQNNTKDFFFWSIRSQHSQSRLEMVWRDSFPMGSFTFIEHFRRYDFCPVYFVLLRLTAPGSPRMVVMLPINYIASQTIQGKHLCPERKEPTVIARIA